MFAPPERSFWSPLFITCATVLLAAAIGLRPALAALIDHYSKEPIDLRQPLSEFDVRQLPSFRYLPADESVLIVGDTEALGTEDWIHYTFRSRTAESDWPVVLFVTYYSDPRDSIPHTPEVCYRQGGAVVNSIETVRVETPGLAPEYPSIEARLLEIDQGKYRTTVLYVICCNGKIVSGRERARWEIMMPGDTHVYFSKVETVAHRPAGEDRRKYVERCKQLLSEALPILVNDHFPLTQDVKRR